MKKILLTALVMMATVATYAQHAVGSISLQPKVGLNIASVTKNDGGSPRYGFAGGAEFEYQAADIFSVSAGLMYSMQGAKNDGETWKADYLNIPVLANFYVTKGLAVKLGLQPGINVNSKIKSNAYFYQGAGVEYEDDGAKDFELSLPVGVSYEFPTVPVVIDARYNWGLTKMTDWSDSKNSVFQITLGYKFDL